MNDELTSAAMQILIDAGSGRNETYRAIKAVNAGDFEAAREHLRTAQEELEKAHKVHTNVIQREAEGGTAEFSALFSHAQDTLMTAYSEYRLVDRLQPVFTDFDARLKALEAK